MGFSGLPWQSNRTPIYRAELFFRSLDYRLQMGQQTDKDLEYVAERRLDFPDLAAVAGTGGGGTAGVAKHPAAAKGAAVGSEAASAGPSVLSRMLAWLEQLRIGSGDPLPTDVEVPGVDTRPKACRCMLGRCSCWAAACWAAAHVWPPLHVGPLHVWPLHVWPLHVGPLHVGSLHVGPLHVGPLHVGPLHVGPLHVGPLFMLCPRVVGGVATQDAS